MKKSNAGLIIGIFITLFVATVTGPISVYAATSPSLGVAGSYSILGHTTVTNTGATTVSGDLGISIGGAPTGFPPGTVGLPGTIRNAEDSLAAQNANTAAFGYIDQACDITYPGVSKDLAGETLVPGVYCADAFELSGTLTLSGQGVWIFKSASTLTTSGEAVVVGGDPCNVWWRVVSSATLGVNTALTGNILALTSISLQTGASLNGRALAQTAAVTLDTNAITGSVCLTAPVYTEIDEPEPTDDEEIVEPEPTDDEETVTPLPSDAQESATPKMPNTGLQSKTGSDIMITVAVAVLTVTLAFLVQKKFLGKFDV